MRSALLLVCLCVVALAENDVGFVADSHDKQLLLVQRRFVSRVMPVNVFVPMAIEVINVGQQAATEVTLRLDASKELLDLFEFANDPNAIFPVLQPGESAVHVVPVKLRRIPHKGETYPASQLAYTDTVVSYHDERGLLHKGHSDQRNSEVPKIISEAKYRKDTNGNVDMWVIFSAVAFILLVLPSYQARSYAERYADEEKEHSTKKATGKKSGGENSKNKKDTATKKAKASDDDEEEVEEGGAAVAAEKKKNGKKQGGRQSLLPQLKQKNKPRRE